MSSANVRGSACPMDCPDTCRLRVTVEDGRVTRLDGDARDPYTAGFICGKVRGYADHQYGPDRIAHPMLRVGAKGSGEFRRIGWDEALDLTAERIREVVARSGPEAILPYAYGGSNGALTDCTVDFRLFRRLGASRLLRTFCAAATNAAAGGVYGRMPGVALEDYVDSRLIVLWGCNPSATSIHLVPVIKEARARGAKLVVIDPRRTPLARQADLHLPVRPGTDLPVALAILGALFDRGLADTAFLDAHANGVAELRRRAAAWPVDRAAAVAGLSADDLDAFVALYAAASPAVIRCGWGIERNRNGAHAVAAVLAIPAVAGKFGVRGGGYTMSQGRAYGMTAGVVGADEPASRAINMCQLGEALVERRDPKVELLFVYNANPAATAPDQARVLAGLAREDLFTVVHEQVMTDTAALADLVLPATTFLEHRELKSSYGAIRLYDSPPVVAPFGESRPNYDVFAELLRRLDLERPGDVNDPGEMVRRMVGSAPEGDRMLAELAADGATLPAIGARPVPFVDVFPLTPSGRIELVPDALDAAAATSLYDFQPLRQTPEFPLQLISPANTLAISSSFYQLVDTPAELRIHPAAAASRGIGDGDAVRVYDARAEVVCKARLDANQREDVVVLPKGLWRKHTANGLTAAALAPDHVTDIGGQGCFNDAMVQVAGA